MQFRINMVVVKMRWSFDVLTSDKKFVAERPRRPNRSARLEVVLDSGQFDGNFARNLESTDRGPSLERNVRMRAKTKPLSSLDSVVEDRIELLRT